MNLILRVQTQNVKAKIESREMRAHRLRKNQLSETGQNGTWVMLLGWPLENCHEKDKNGMSSILDTVSSFCCSPGDWLTFCSITALDIWVREPSRTLEPGEEKFEDLCSRFLFPSIHQHTAPVRWPLTHRPSSLGFHKFPSFYGPSRLRGSRYQLPAAFWLSQPCTTNKNAAQSCLSLRSRGL